MTATLIGFTGLASCGAETPELFPLRPQWEPLFSVRHGGGYKDNIFLSPTTPQGSAFLSGGGDIMALRLVPGGPQFSFFGSADVTHFLEPSHTEYTTFALAKLERDFSDNWKGSVAAEYIYQDQFADVAFLDPGTNVTVRAAAIRSHTITLRPGVEWALPQNLSLALETPVTRAFYNAPLDDYWHGGVKLTFARNYGHDSQLSLSYEPAWRFYDNELALSETGAPVTGTHRQRFQQEAVFTWRQHWDEAKHWRTVAKAGGRLVEENEGGYADHTQWFGTAQVRYRATPWEFSAESRVRVYDYRVQPFSVTDPRKRQRTEWSAGASVERELTRYLRVVVSYDYERIFSEDKLEAYTVNTVSASLQWEF